MAATDARPVPRKNVAYRVTFPILDADGDLVTGAATLDSEVSKDGGAFADATNEATEIATSSGVYFLDLTSTEMNADTVAVIVKTSTAGAKTTTIVMYPEEDGDYKVNVVQVGGTAQTAGDLKGSLNTIQADTDDIQTKLPSTLIAGRMQAVVGAMDANVLTAAVIAADAVTEIQSGLSTLTAAQVNAEMVDALNVDTYTEIGQEAPAATQTIRKMLGYLYKAWRNRSTQTATAYNLYNDDAITVGQKATVSDDGTTFDSGEKATGP